MNETTAPRRAYVLALLNSVWRHGLELASAVLAIAAVMLVVLFVSPRNAVTVFAPVVATVIAAQIAVAAWRIHHIQNVVIATNRSLVELNVKDRADLETDLRSRYAKRAQRLENRHAAELQRLGVRPATQRVELDRAADDGWDIDHKRESGLDA